MQTFLLSDKEFAETIYFKDLCKGLEFLDNKRLNKQILEAYQILQILIKGTGRYLSHPVVQMWMSSENLLARYGFECCKAFQSKSAIKTIHKYMSFFEEYCYTARHAYFKEPFWLENQNFLHELVKSHKSNLQYKDSSYYQFNDIDSNLLYVWPSYYVFDKNNGFRISYEGKEALLKTCKRKAIKEDVYQSEILNSFMYYDGNKWVRALHLMEKQ